MMLFADAAVTSSIREAKRQVAQSSVQLGPSAGCCKCLHVVERVAHRLRELAATRSRDPAFEGHSQNRYARIAGVQLARSFADQGVRSSSVRFAPTVHGDGDHGFTAVLVAIARERGVSGYVGDGSNHWPAVHRLDAVHLVRLAVEQAPAGAALHAGEEEGVPTRAIAEAVGAGARRTRRLCRSRSGSGSLRLVGSLLCHRFPRLEHLHSSAAGLAPDPTRAPSRPCRRPLLPDPRSLTPASVG